MPGTKAGFQLPPGALALGLITLGFFALMMVAVIPEYQKSHRLASNGKAITAEIIDLSPVKGRAKQARYSYVVDGRSYRGKCVVPQSWDSYGPLPIVYLPDSPGYSDYDPQKRAGDATFALVITSFLQVTLAGVLIGVCMTGRVPRSL